MFELMLTDDNPIIINKDHVKYVTLDGSGAVIVSLTHNKGESCEFRVKDDYKSVVKKIKAAK